MSAMANACDICHEAIVGDGHAPLANSTMGMKPEKRSMICESCYNAIEARTKDIDPRQIALLSICGDKQLIPGHTPMPLPDHMSANDVLLKRLAMYRFVAYFADSKSLCVNIIDKDVHTSSDWQKWCVVYARQHPKSILLLKWNYTKPWCIARTNMEIVQGNIEVLATHFAVYHKDAFVRICLYQELEQCKKDFLKFIEQDAGKPVEECPICMEKCIVKRYCTTCKNPVCLTCARNIEHSRTKKCPFCRADFLTREARLLLAKANK